ncbi:hypothetical protein QBC44DRAFT_334504 [Cladorrhinum sp. PSN332]|nr:hypothetical protein QBC44DRAFT_334504 [Cladorrhinum sp. PSN332]
MLSCQSQVGSGSVWVWSGLVMVGYTGPRVFNEYSFSLPSTWLICGKGTGLGTGSHWCLGMVGWGMDRCLLGMHICTVSVGICVCSFDLLILSRLYTWLF